MEEEPGGAVTAASDGWLGATESTNESSDCEEDGRAERRPRQAVAGLFPFLAEPPEAGAAAASPPLRFGAALDAAVSPLALGLEKKLRMSIARALRQAEFVGSLSSWREALGLNRRTVRGCCFLYPLCFWSRESEHQKR